MNSPKQTPPRSETARPDPEEPVTPFEDPAAAKAAEGITKSQPAQVTVEEKRHAERHPEDVPPPGDMGPDEGPGS